jgi:NADPH:quinone reductase-like Zn-dependent oxidoreductase/acyl carrier protein
VLGARRLIAALANASVPVWFVTRQARRVLEEDGVDGLASTPLIGLARVANNEQGCRFFQIDLDDCAAPEAAALLAAHLTGPVDGEFEEAYRNGVRYVPRLEAAPPREWPPRTFPARRGRTMRPYRLEIDRPGVLEHLALHETEPRPLAAGDVEIDVRAGGLNFRDVMKALGSYPGHPADQRWLGDDVSGVVRRVGADVTDWRPGDEVAGVAPYAFQSLATADARLLFRKPASWSFAEAATVPTAFLTAHYALVHLARLQPGERVLIHAGAGGVGQAAIQIARRLQLEIFATAGSPAKRQRLLDDGADHVMDSRTLDFADEIRSLTGGAGVDAVLNSLAGEFVTKSLSVLAPFGRFLEIGKADVYRRSRFELHALRRNIAFFVIDLAEHLTQKHPVVVRLLDELARSFDAGDYRPLPLTTFPVDRAPDAFRHLAQARHVGKVVLTFDRPDVPIACSSDDAHRFRGDVTYLVTGGAGGVGLEVARWIAGHGGRYFALVSRSGPRDESAAAAIDALRGAGHVVHDFRADVAVTADVDRVLATIDAHLPPLGGVFHAAMVLDDALLGELDDDRMWRAMAPKVLGGWNLHAATRDRVTVEHFVCFSSVSTVIAAPGQANYNAGNVFLEALADYRRGQGLPAQTVSWGAIADAGYVARHPQTAAALATVGISAVRIEEALQVLQAIVVVDLPHVVAARVAWPEVLNLSPLAATANAYAAVRHQSSAGDRSGPLEARLRSTPPGEWPRRVEELIAGHVAAVLGTARARLDRAAPLNSLGLDSLMTLELINRLDRDIGVRVPIGNVSAGASVAELAKVVLRTMAPGQTRSAGEEPAGLKTGRSVNHLVLLRAAETDGAGEPPLFGFHPVGGGVSVYAPLAAQIAPAIPVYGVESRLLLGDAWEYADVDEMVTAYTGAVRRAHAGPYRLFGFSLGGYVAARVAEALERDGRTVDVVGVIDWDARPNLAPDAQRQALTRLAVAAYRYLQQDAGVLQTRSEGSLEPEMARLVDRVFDEQSGGDVFFSWAVERGLLLSTDLEGFARSYLARLEQHCRLLTRPLRRPRLQAPLYVWRASRGFGSPLASWEHTGQAGRELVIDGDHNALIRPAALERIASLLNDVFDRQATGKTR